MKKVGMFAVLTLLLAVAVLADSDYLETMRRREVLMMNSPRYARTQNPRLQAWALGQVQLTAEEVHQLRAKRQAKARENRAKLAAEAQMRQWQSGMAFAPGMGQPRAPGFPGLRGGGTMGLPGIGGYSGGAGFPGAAARGSILGPGGGRTVSVRGHTRRTPSGGTTNVRPHRRSPPSR